MLEQVTCKECTTTFTAQRVFKRKYCSRPCAVVGWKRLGIQLLRTKETFERIQAAKVGRKRPEISGPNHYGWKGGKGKHYKTGYYSTDYINWREAVFARDNFTCQHCGASDYVTAHHIKSFAHYPELRFDIQNGLTLCETCHSKTDNYKGRARKRK